MITKYSSYKVKIKDNRFTTSDGLVFSSTAAISFYENKKEIAYIETGYIDTEDIYILLDTRQPVNIDGCYIENFSLSEYRKSRNIDKSAYVKIASFSAVGTFFESVNLNDFSFAEFNEGDVTFENAHFINGATSFHAARFGKGNVNFSYIYFNNGNADFSNASFNDGDITFKNSIFGKGTKDFQYASFGNGDIAFINTEFGDGDVNFINTDFGSGEVSFKVARFGIGKVDFKYAKFGKGDISFERAEFGDGRKDFSKVEFNEGRINFNRTIFNSGEITFEGSILSKGKMSFKRTILGNGDINFEIAEYQQADVIFEGVDFGSGNVSFYNSKFHLLCLQSCHLDNYLDLRVAHCSYLDLSNAIVENIIDIKPFDFNVDIKIFNITNMRLLGKIYIDWEENKVFQIITSQEKTSFYNKAEQFRILKENFGTIGQYNDEDKSYVAFKRFEQKADLEKILKKNKLNGFWYFPAYGFKWLVFDKAGLYATSPARVLLSLIIVFFIFSFILFFVPFFTDSYINCVPENASFLDKMLTSFYFSGITFFTVGYGDCTPVGILRLISVIEVFFGVFMISYFTVAFARKILR
ncbi:MAG: two pore domain potassium channel family protein [Bacteroidia bacterium]|nr:two pore domain potassium channel family protein [Bacteroidia bacterium]